MAARPKDIVERIRGLRYVHVPVASELMAEAATAIETLRWQLKIRENIVGRLVAENERLRNGAVEGCETVQQEPVAWAILHKDHRYVSLLRETAEAHNVYVDAEIVPLYRSPQPTLTDEEREAIEDAVGICEEHAEEYDGTDSSPIADTLRSLLERLRA